MFMVSDDGCVFCKISRKEIPAELLAENDNFFAILDLNQDIRNHALIISKKHYTNLMDMPATLGTELLGIVKIIAEKNLKSGSDGFKVVVNNFPAAGQVVMHAHIHLLPRNKGDGAEIKI